MRCDSFNISIRPGCIYMVYIVVILDGTWNYAIAWGWVQIGPQGGWGVTKKPARSVSSLKRLITALI